MQGANELCKKLAAEPKDEHIPLTEIMFALAIKNIAISMLGLCFEDETELLKLSENYEVVSGKLIIFYNMTQNSCQRVVTLTDIEIETIIRIVLHRFFHH